MFPVDQVRFSVPVAAARAGKAAHPADPEDVLTLMGSNLRKNPPTASDLRGPGQLARSDDPLLRRIGREGLKRLGSELRPDPWWRLNPEEAAAAGLNGLNGALQKLAGCVGVYEDKELPVKEVLGKLEQEIGTAPVPEASLRSVALLTTNALEKNQFAEECVELLQHWQKSGQIELEGSPDQLARGLATVEGSRVTPLPPRPPLSPLSQSLLESEAPLPAELPVDLQHLDLLVFNDKLINHALSNERKVPADFLSTLVKRGCLDQPGAAGELVQLYCQSHPDQPEGLLDVIGQRAWKTDVAACQILGSSKLAGQAASVLIERVDSERARGHHLQLLSEALDSGWKPSPKEAQWLVAQLFDERYLRRESITQDTGGFAHVSTLTTLLSKTQGLHPGIFDHCKLPDCSSELVDLRAAMVDIMRHNCQDQPAARVDPARHPEMKAYFDLAPPTREEVQGMVDDLRSGFKETGLYHPNWSQEQMALLLLSVYFEKGALHPDDRSLVQDAVRPLLTYDTWRWSYGFHTLGDVLNRFRDSELECGGPGLHRLMVAAQRGTDEKAADQTSEIARELWKDADHEAIFAQLGKLPKKLDDLEPDEMAPVLLAVSNDPDRAAQALGPALAEMDTMRYSETMQGKLLMDLRDRDILQDLENLKQGHIPPSRQLDAIARLVEFHQGRYDQEKGEAEKTVHAAWNEGVDKQGHEPIPLETLKLLVEVRGDRAWEALPLYGRLKEKLQEPDDALRDMVARLDQGVPEDQAFEEALRAHLVGGASPAPTTSMGMVGEGQLSVGGSLLRIRKSR